MAAKPKQAARRKRGEPKPPTREYPTRPELVRALLSVERFGGPVWEPFAGSGALVRELLANGVRPVVASSLGRCPCGVGDSDFFLHVVPRGPNIISNTPFDRGLPERAVLHALKLGVAKLALLLPLQFLGGEERNKGLFREAPPVRVWVVSDRVAMYPLGWTGKVGKAVITLAWFVWEAPARPGTMPDVGWVMAKEFLTVA